MGGEILLAGRLNVGGDTTSAATDTRAVTYICLRQAAMRRYIHITSWFCVKAADAMLEPTLTDN